LYPELGVRAWVGHVDVSRVVVLARNRDRYPGEIRFRRIRVQREVDGRLVGERGREACVVGSGGHQPTRVDAAGIVRFECDFAGDRLSRGDSVVVQFEVGDVDRRIGADPERLVRALVRVVGDSAEAERDATLAALVQEVWIDFSVDDLCRAVTGDVRLGVGHQHLADPVAALVVDDQRHALVRCVARSRIFDGYLDVECLRVRFESSVAADVDRRDVEIRAERRGQIRRLLDTNRLVETVLAPLVDELVELVAGRGAIDDAGDRLVGEFVVPVTEAEPVVPERVDWLDLLIRPLDVLPQFARPVPDPPLPAVVSFARRPVDPDGVVVPVGFGDFEAGVSIEGGVSLFEPTRRGIVEFGGELRDAAVDDRWLRAILDAQSVAEGAEVDQHLILAEVRAVVAAVDVTGVDALDFGLGVGRPSLREFAGDRQLNSGLRDDVAVALDLLVDGSLNLVCRQRLPLNP